jgi:hypothetical protein
MSKSSILLVITAMIVAVPVLADPPTFTFGGEIHARGEWWEHEIVPYMGYMSGEDYYGIDYEDDVNFYLLRGRFNVLAEMTKDVKGFMEFQTYAPWGGNDTYYFMGDTPAQLGVGSYLGRFPEMYPDYRSMANELNDADVNLYQAYIEVNNIMGWPVDLRVGRQEMVYGTELFVGNNSFYGGLSFDAIKLMAHAGDVDMHVWKAKLVEGWGEDDWDFWGWYNTYSGIDNMVIDGYIFYLNDQRKYYWQPWERPDDMDHVTVGFRAAGSLWEAWDYNAEVAWQWGNWYGSEEVEAWAVDVSGGYTFDTLFTPHIGFGYSFASGDNSSEDSKYENFFNLFGDMHGRFGELDLLPSFSNVHIAQLNLNATFAEDWVAGLNAYYFWLNRPYEGWVMDEYHSWPSGETDENGDAILAETGTWKWKRLDNELGGELDAFVTYQYSENLTFRLCWAHLFAQEYIEDFYSVHDYQWSNGVYGDSGYASAYSVGVPWGDNDDIDRVYLMAHLSF